MEIKLNENLAKLTTVFDMFETDYEIISETEIAIPCPLDGVPEEVDLLLPEIEILSPPNKVVCFSDEAMIHIRYSVEHECFSWLVVFTNYEDDED